jgi:hypothetical protein
MQMEKLVQKISKSDFWLENDGKKLQDCKQGDTH